MPQINNEEEALELLRILVDDFGMSKTAVAGNLKISRVSLTNVMNGKNAVTPAFLLRFNNLINKLKTTLADE